MATAMRMTVVVAAIALMLVQCVTSTILTVGDDSGWAVPTSPKFYSEWAAKQSFAVDDILAFNFPASLHTVAQVTSKDAYDSCDVTLEADATILKSTANVTLVKEGTYYFFCTIGTHCEKGQKLTVIVPSTAAADTADTPKSSPSPASPPTSHEDHGSAPRISGFSVLFVPIVMSLVVLAKLIA